MWVSEIRGSVYLFKEAFSILIIIRLYFYVLVEDLFWVEGIDLIKEYYWRILI